MDNLNNSKACHYRLRVYLVFITHRCCLAVPPLSILDIGLDVAAPLPVITCLGPGDLQTTLVVVVIALNINYHKYRITYLVGEKY